MAKVIFKCIESKNAKQFQKAIDAYNAECPAVSFEHRQNSRSKFSALIDTVIEYTVDEKPNIASLIKSLIKENLKIDDVIFESETKSPSVETAAFNKELKTSWEKQTKTRLVTNVSPDNVNQATQKDNQSASNGGEPTAGRSSLKYFWESLVSGIQRIIDFLSQPVATAKPSEAGNLGDKEKDSEIPLKAFDQTDLIAKVNLLNIPYLQLNPTGVCNGLVIDYSRYHLNHSDGDYIAKLKRKFPVETTVSSENFFRRIELYQRKLQNLGPESFFKDMGCSMFKIMGLLDECSFVQLSFGRFPGEGHTTVIRKIHDQDGNTVGYKLFDPLKGEFDCTSKDNLELNKEDLKRLIQKLSDAYPRLGEISLRNLESSVKKLDITKEASDEKKGDKKYASEYDIFYAIKREDYRTARILLQSNPQLANARDDREKTPLMLIKNIEIASMLLDLGASAYSQDNQKCSALSNFYISKLLQSRRITLEHTADKHSEIELLANSLRLSSLDIGALYNDFDKPRVMDDYRDWEGFKKQGPLFKNKIIALLSLGADYDGCAEKSPELTEIIDKIKGDLQVIHSALLNPDTPLTEDILALLKNYIGTSPLYIEDLILSCRGPKQSVIMDLFYKALVESDHFESIANMIHFADETQLPIILDRIIDRILESSIAKLAPFLNACKKADLQRICLPLFSILSEKGLPGLIVNIAFPAATQRLESHEKKEVAIKAIQCLQAQHLRDSIVQTFADEDSKAALRKFSYQNSCRRIKANLSESKTSAPDEGIGVIKPLFPNF